MGAVEDHAVAAEVAVAAGHGTTRSLDLDRAEGVVEAGEIEVLRHVAAVVAVLLARVVRAGEEADAATIMDREIRGEHERLPGALAEAAIVERHPAAIVLSAHEAPELAAAVDADADAFVDMAGGRVLDAGPVVERAAEIGPAIGGPAGAAFRLHRSGGQSECKRENGACEKTKNNGHLALGNRK